MKKVILLLLIFCLAQTGYSQTKRKLTLDEVITLAKKNTLASRRRAIAKLMIRHNRLTPKEARAVKKGDLSSYNADRRIIEKLFDQLSQRYLERPGGYTRIIRKEQRKGDNAPLCMIEYI